MKELLFIREKPGEGFSEKLTIDNVQRSKLTLLIVILFELIMLTRNIIRHGFSLHIYVIFYIVLLVVAMATYAYVHYVMKKNPEKSRHLDRVIFSFYIFDVLWGGALTVLDQSSYGQVTAYLSNVLVGVLMYHTTMKKFAIMQFIPFALVVAGIYIVQPVHSVFIAHVINMAIYLVFATIGSRFLYNYAANSFTQHQKLLQSNEQLEAVNEQLRDISERDELTNLPNRRGLYRFMDENLNGSGTVQAILLDVDAFKQYNDYYGHLEGDSVLMQVADVLRKYTRSENAFVARFGGEEFIILLIDYDQTQGFSVAENLRRGVVQLQIPHSKSPFGNVISASCGVSAIHEQRDLQATKMFAEADETLYKAKNNGRNKVQPYILQR
ncbi:GGDEF domain-containing protein [Kurthia senegalensis]|uniref:GGDEF domain-containing protein n=1 Tax=Kurthia senegalensis TaxID=1033740 RepID=UPI00028A2B0B|nr:GGDEF domain-containing protein [Kurthia senegalensis]